MSGFIPIRFGFWVLFSTLKGRKQTFAREEGEKKKCLEVLLAWGKMKQVAGPQKTELQIISAASVFGRKLLELL